MQRVMQSSYIHFILTMKQKNGPVGEIKMSVSEKTGLLTSMVYKYVTGETVYITFEKFDTSPDFTPNTFAKYFKSCNSVSSTL